MIEEIRFNFQSLLYRLSSVWNLQHQANHSSFCEAKARAFPASLLMHGRSQSRAIPECWQVMGITGRKNMHAQWNWGFSCTWMGGGRGESNFYPLFKILPQFAWEKMWNFILRVQASLYTLPFLHVLVLYLPGDGTGVSSWPFFLLFCWCLVHWVVLNGHSQSKPQSSLCFLFECTEWLDEKSLDCVQKPVLISL